MGLERTFLGWNRPFLRGVADWLVDRAGTNSSPSLDLSGFTVVTPSRAASRRLREILLERAENDGGLLVPPRSLTPRALLDVLLGIEGARISPLEAEIVMTLAIRELEQRAPERLRVLVGHPPQDDHADSWSALGARLVRLRDEVSGAGLGVDTTGWPEAAQVCISVGLERERWSVVHEIMESYEGLLASMERRDWVMALGDGVASTNLGSIVLAGASDLFPAVAGLIRGAVDRGTAVHALVRAPQELHEGFDDLGGLRIPHWLARRLDIPDDAIAVVEAPVDQARAVANAIGGLGGEFDVSEISLALANTALASHIEVELASRGVPTRYAGGRPAGRTAPYLLLSELSRYGDGRGYKALAGLARHPDLRHGSAALEALDTYALDHLPARTPSPGRGPGSHVTDSGPAQARRNEVDEVVVRVERCAGALAQGEPMDVVQVAHAVRHALGDVYKDQSFDQARREERARLMALEELSRAAQSFEDLSPVLVETVGRRPPAELMRLLLRHAAERAVPDPENPHAIEMTDWLEVVLDDAPVLIIAGLNEGFVPQSVMGDPILPDGLRAALGISHNDQRMAREVHGLTAMLEERADHGKVAIISGRVDAAREPLIPSRLLLRGTRPQDVVERTRVLFQQSVAGPSLLHPALMAVSPGRGLPRIIPAPGDVYPHTSLSVTAFKSYIACPYRFWLNHVMKLREIDDQALELDASRFGTMVHAVLERFGNEQELRSCADADQIRRALGCFLDEYTEGQFGPNARRTVAIQATLARRRLDAFAARQAERVQEGWRTVAVEHRVGREDHTVALALEGEPFYVHGRIDRVDVHEDGRLAVLDYKTSATVPDRDHRKGAKNSKIWVNLQLPLYRKLAETLDVAHSSVVTGYVLLPRDPGRAGFYEAQWDEAALQEADELAVQVASRIRDGVFWPPAGEPPQYSEALAAICQEGALNAQAIGRVEAGTGGAAWALTPL